MIQCEFTITTLQKSAYHDIMRWNYMLIPSHKHVLKKEGIAPMKTRKQHLISIGISIATFLILYLLAYIFLGIYTGQCGSTTRRWVANSDTIIIAIISILAGSIYFLIPFKKSDPKDD